MVSELLVRPLPRSRPRDLMLCRLICCNVDVGDIQLVVGAIGNVQAWATLIWLSTV